MIVILPNDLSRWMEDEICGSDYAAASKYVVELIEKDRARRRVSASDVAEMQCVDLSCEEGQAGRGLEDFAVRVAQRRGRPTT